MYLAETSSQRFDPEIDRKFGPIDQCSDRIPQKLFGLFSVFPPTTKIFENNFP